MSKRTQCRSDPRPPTGGDDVRRLADYAAGYAAAQAEECNPRDYGF